MNSESGATQPISGDTGSPGARVSHSVALAESGEYRCTFRYAPAVLGISLRQELKSPSVAIVGEDVIIEVALDTAQALDDVEFTTRFDPRHLRFVASSPGGCAPLGPSALASQALLVCDVGSVASETVSFTLTFEAVAPTGDLRTSTAFLVIASVPGSGTVSLPASDAELDIVPSLAALGDADAETTRSGLSTGLGIAIPLAAAIALGWLVARRRASA